MGRGEVCCTWHNYIVVVLITFADWKLQKATYKSFGIWLYTVMNVLDWYIDLFAYTLSQKNVPFLFLE